jgi:hypothetical protein
MVCIQPQTLSRTVAKAFFSGFAVPHEDQVLTRLSCRNLDVTHHSANFDADLFLHTVCHMRITRSHTGSLGYCECGCTWNIRTYDWYLESG